MNHFDDEDRLIDELRERSSEINGHTIGFDAVRQSAKRMQRRRNVVSGAVAVAVASVAVPAGLAMAPGLIAADGPAENPSLAARPTPSSEATITTLRGPTALTMEVPVGAAPQLSYFLGEDYVVTDGRTLQFEHDYTTVVPFADGLLAQGYAGASAQVFFLDESGKMLGESQASGQGLVTSADGSQIGYVLIKDDGTQTLVNAPASGSDPVTWNFPAFPAVIPVGFADNDTLVYEAVEGGEVEGVYTARPGSRIDLVPHLLGASSAANGLVAGVTERKLASICSGVVDVITGDLLWSDCAYATGEFSPDGKWVVATSADGDGFGHLGLAIVDADTGTPVVEYGQATRRGQVTLGDPEWESDRALLSPINDANRYGLIRLDLAGETEKRH